MELVAVLRVLWRHRVLVIVAALIAVIAGASLAYRVGVPPESRQYSVGLGEATALVDTPSSQVVDLGGETGPDIRTLSGRATLLASLMTSSPIKDEIAKRAGADPEKLIAIPPPSDVGITDASAAAALKNPEAIMLKARVPTLESGEIPIIAIETQAPDAALAAKLADESIAALKDQLQSVAGADDVPDARRVVVTALGPARANTVTRGPKPTLAIVAALFVFGLGCLAIVGVGALVNLWREAKVMDDFDDEDIDGFVFDDPADAPLNGAREADPVEERGARHSDVVGF
jgi:capsular polysaccharide biosynthesis protein